MSHQKNSRQVSICRIHEKALFSPQERIWSQTQRSESPSRRFGRPNGPIELSKCYPGMPLHGVVPTICRLNLRRYMVPTTFRLQRGPGTRIHGVSVEAYILRRGATRCQSKMIISVHICNYIRLIKKVVAKSQYGASTRKRCFAPGAKLAPNAAF